jgi:hypothetical protein
VDGDAQDKVDSCDRVVQSLVAAGAWSTDASTFKRWQDLGIGIHLVDELRRLNVLASSEDEFGEMTLGLVPSSVMLPTVYNAQVDTVGALCLPLYPDEYASAHKLRLVLELQRQGWQGMHAALTYTSGSPKEFSLSMVPNSSLYFRSLLQAEDMFDRGLQHVLSGRPHGYYRCLLELPNLAPLIAIADADLVIMTNDHFLVLLRGQGLDFVADPLLALADAEVEGADLIDPLAIEDDIEPLAPPRAAEVVGPIAGGADEFDELQTLVLHGHAIRFTLSHASGRPRAYIRCAHGHEACFKYRQLNQDPDKATTVGFCIAWAEMGALLTREEHQDPALVISPDEVEHFAALYG